jgi:hypothetical protein
MLPSLGRGAGRPPQLGQLRPSLNERSEPLQGCKRLPWPHPGGNLRLIGRLCPRRWFLILPGRRPQSAEVGLMPQGRPGQGQPAAQHPPGSSRSFRNFVADPCSGITLPVTEEARALSADAPVAQGAVPSGVRPWGRQGCHLRLPIATTPRLQNLLVGNDSSPPGTGLQPAHPGMPWFPAKALPLFRPGHSRSSWRRRSSNARRCTT